MGCGLAGQTHTVRRVGPCASEFGYGNGFRYRIQAWRHGILVPGGANWSREEKFTFPARPGVVVLRRPMLCPYCQTDNDKVIDSRSSDAGKVIRRRRECLGCAKRFTTYERVEELSKLIVIKRDGSRVPFNRDNILRGIQSACGKRPISENIRVGMVDQIEEFVHRNYDREVPTSVIGELVCAKLRDADEVAYIRFASEYHQFKDVGELVASVRELTMRVKDVKGQDKLF